MQSILNFFRSNKKRTSANIARDRLQVIVAHEKRTAIAPEWMPKMQKEILEVIKKYTEISNEQLKIEVKNEGDIEVLEINADLELSVTKSTASTASTPSSKKEEKAAPVSAVCKTKSADSKSEKENA